MHTFASTLSYKFSWSEQLLPIQTSQFSYKVLVNHLPDQISTARSHIYFIRWYRAPSNPWAGIHFISNYHLHFFWSEQPFWNPFKQKKKSLQEFYRRMGILQFQSKNQQNRNRNFVDQIRHVEGIPNLRIDQLTLLH